MENSGDTIFDTNSDNKLSSLFFTVCKFQSNKGSNALFKLSYLQASFQNISFYGNQGRIWSLDTANITEKFMEIINHTCLQDFFEGCLKYMEQSILASEYVSVKSMKSFLFRDSIVASYSFISITNFIFEDIETSSSFALFTLRNCTLNFQNSFINSFGKTLFYLELVSSLIILNSSFHNLTGNLDISSFFECNQCKQVRLQNVSIVNCSIQTGTCFKLSLGI